MSVAMKLNIKYIPSKLKKIFVLFLIEENNSKFVHNHNTQCFQKVNLQGKQGYVGKNVNLHIHEFRRMSKT